MATRGGGSEGACVCVVPGVDITVVPILTTHMVFLSIYKPLHINSSVVDDFDHKLAKVAEGFLSTYAVLCCCNVMSN